MELAVFKRTVHEAARPACGRVADIIEPDVTPQLPRRPHRDRTGALLRPLLPCRRLGLRRSHRAPLAPLRFMDCPAIADAMHSLFGLTPFTRAEMQAPLSARPGLSESDLRYWKPRTLGDALFNWWDGP